MTRRVPGHAVHLRRQLKRMAELSAAGDRHGAWRIFESLPATPRAVVSMLLYFGRFG